MLKRNRRYLFFIGFLLFSSYGGYLTFNSESDTVLNDNQPIQVTPTKNIQEKTDHIVYLQGNEVTKDNDKLQVINFDEKTFEYHIQPGVPVGLSSWTHDCDWMGVGGQVFNGDEPAMDIVIEMGGHLDGEEILGLSITGLVDSYGGGGYEISLSDHPIESSNTLWIQLLDLSGKPLSQKVFLSTYDECSKNLVMVNFVKTEELWMFQYYYPVIYR